MSSILPQISTPIVVEVPAEEPVEAPKEEADAEAEAEAPAPVEEVPLPFTFYYCYSTTLSIFLCLPSLAIYTRTPGTSSTTTLPLGTQVQRVW